MRHAGDDVGVAAADQVGNAPEGARGILQDGGQAHAVSLCGRWKKIRSTRL